MFHIDCLWWFLFLDQLALMSWSLLKIKWKPWSLTTRRKPPLGISFYEIYEILERPSEKNAKNVPLPLNWKLNRAIWKLVYQQEIRFTLNMDQYRWSSKKQTVLISGQKFWHQRYPLFRASTVLSIPVIFAYFCLKIFHVLTLQSY